MQAIAGGQKYAQNIYGELYNTRTGELKSQEDTSGGTSGSSTGSIGSKDYSSMYTGKNGPAFANNNPGNIKDTAFGGTAGGQGGFTKFATVEDGVNALLKKIQYNQANGVN